MNRDDDKISPEEMADALNRSGYLLETRVEDALVDAAFTVEANTCYPDPLTGKSRELDIYAVTLEPVDAESDDNNDIVCSVVLCECSNNSQPLVFLSKDWASTPFDSEKVHVSGMPDVIPANDLPGVQMALDLYSFLHHFESGRIATQYCTFGRKKSDSSWMATHDADDHGSFSKLCDYIAWKKEQDRLNWAPTPKVEDERINLTFYFPVFVVQNDLYEAHQDPKSGVEMLPVNRLLFRQSNAVASTVDFLIDVVRESALPKLLDKITRDQAEVATRIRKLHRNEFRKAVESLWRTRGYGKMPRKA